MIFFLLSVESLPTPYSPTNSGSYLYGARALPSMAGNGAILQNQEYLYELKRNTHSCHWIIMEQTLRKSVSMAVMIYLPPGYTC